MTTPADIDMGALIEWAHTFDPPPCAEGVVRARLGWVHMSWSDRAWVAKRCGPELHQVLAIDPDWQVRDTVADHCGPELHEALSQDSFWVVRETVAQWCGPELLAVLAHDPDQTVRAKAVERIKETS